MTDIQKFKAELEAEKAKLETQIADLGTPDTETPGGYGAHVDLDNVDEADENLVADKFEDEENSQGILNQLEERHADVLRALLKMEAGKYGICEVCQLPIEEKRLAADATAVTCIMHRESSHDDVEEEEGEVE